MYFDCARGVSSSRQTSTAGVAGRLVWCKAGTRGGRALWFWGRFRGPLIDQSVQAGIGSGELGVDIIERGRVGVEFGRVGVEACMSICHFPVQASNVVAIFLLLFAQLLYGVHKVQFVFVRISRAIGSSTGRLRHWSTERLSHFVFLGHVGLDRNWFASNVVLPDLSASNTQTLGSKAHCLDNYGKHLNYSPCRLELNLI